MSAARCSKLDVVLQPVVRIEETENEMMSAQAFHKKSKSVFTQGRSEFIQDIESLLGHFHQSVSYNRKMKIAALIYFEAAWHARTKPKSKRRKAVHEVRDQARTFLDSGYSLMMLDQKVDSGLSTKGGNVSFKYGGKGLDSDYKWEVILPNKNIVSKCGSSFESVIGDDHYFGMSDIDEQTIKGINKPSKALDALLDKWFDTEDVDTRKFMQMNGQDRANYQLSYQDGAIHWAGNPGQPFSAAYCDCSQGSGDPDCVSDMMQGCAFAMDLDDDVYMWSGNAYNINHSSFMSGKPVKCAGMIHIKGGRVVGVNNGSGHYKPSTKFLAQAVETLVNVYHQSPITMKVFDKSNENQPSMMAAQFRNQYGTGG
jgi:hypothetical protein